jgi:siroheme synthase-like protein
VVIIGGGSVASRKVGTLLAHGARLLVVSPEVTDTIADRAAAGEIELQRRGYTEGDLDGAILAIAATGDGEVNRRVAEEARSRSILVNVIDDPESCDVTFPAPLERGAIQVAVWSGGSPALSRNLRNRLAHAVPPQYAGYSRLLGSIRAMIVRAVRSEKSRREIFDALVSEEILDQLERRAFEPLLTRVRALLVEHDLSLPPGAEEMLTGAVHPPDGGE